MKPKLGGHTHYVSVVVAVQEQVSATVDFRDPGLNCWRYRVPPAQLARSARRGGGIEERLAAGKLAA